MKKSIFIISLLFFLTHAEDANLVPADAVLIDTIEAVVFGQGGTEIVTHSDVIRPSLTGAQQKRDDIIFERLVYLDAQKFKIAPDEEGLDRYLAEIQKQNNLTLDDLKKIFSQAGYTYEEGREQFKRLQTVKTMMDFKVSSNLVIPRRQVEEYYDQHPLKEEGMYYLKHGFVSFEKDREKQKQKLSKLTPSSIDDFDIQWQEPYWFKKSEISDDKDFLFSLKTGSISEPQQTMNGFEFYYMIDKKDERIVPLEERYGDIVETLQRPKYQELMDKYKNQLFGTVSILSFG